MQLRKIRLILFGLILIVTASAVTLVNSIDYLPFGEDYLNMEGVQIKHSIHNSNDNLSSSEIIELQDEDGLSLWFARFFYKDICISGICRMAKFWIFWDGGGNYLGYRLYKNEPLTKGNHVDFLSSDYLRLDEILADTNSVLKDLEYDDLFSEITNDHHKKSIFEVDGYTRATSPSLSDHVVKDAVFTCFTLWHTVYGETKEEINSILSNRIDYGYLKKLLNGKDANQILALNYLGENIHILPIWEEEILKSINSENKYISDKAITLLSNEFLASKEKQINLIKLIERAPTHVTYEIIYKLQSIGFVSEDAISLLLDMYLENKLNVGTLNLVYKIISDQLENGNGLNNSMNIKKRLMEIHNSDNAYASSLTNTLLKKF